MILRSRPSIFASLQANSTTSRLISMCLRAILPTVLTIVASLPTILAQDSLSPAPRAQIH